MPNLNNVPTLPPYLLERLSACYSQEQTARILQVSQVQASRLERRSLQKLRDLLAEE